MYNPFDLRNFPTNDQAMVLIEHGDLLITNANYTYSVMLYNYNCQFWELVYQYDLKKVLLVRLVTPEILEKHYLNQIKLKL
jgi:hypothetical protein